MIHLGDITKISGYEVPITDCVIGGSPCQDLSVAGKRAGLDGERSGLFMEQLRIVKEMRECDRQYGKSDEFIRPRFMVWENVPGAFSSNKSEDFRVVLEEIAKVCDKDAVIPMPPSGKWTTAGCIMGDGWSVAWRVCDAQFYGVPQRRRRIALIADFGGQSAPEILFVRKNVSRDTESSQSQRKETTTDATRGIGADDRKCMTFQWQDGAESSLCISNNVAPAISCSRTPSAVYCFEPGIASREGGHIYENVSGTIRANAGDNQMSTVYSVDQVGGKSACNVQEGQAPTLTCTHGGEPVVALDRASFNQGKNALYDFEVSDKGVNSPLVAKGPSAVCYSFDPTASRDAGDYVLDGICNPLINGTCPGHKRAVCYQDSRVKPRYIVRRLTPLECERLQGYPDGWTDIGEWTDSKGKVHKTSDAARYKALGNSIALPPWKWVLKRLCACYERDATMASLFDGIGGFPLIWEQLNGKGTCLWASEIEEFPMAVTKVRIG